MTDTATKLSLADRGIHSVHRHDMGEWDLWVQNYVGDQHFKSTISIQAKILTDNALSSTMLTLPTEVVFALGELIAELREKMGQTPEVFAGKTVDAWLS